MARLNPEQRPSAKDLLKDVQKAGPYLFVGAEESGSVSGLEPEQDLAQGFADMSIRSGAYSNGEYTTPQSRSYFSEHTPLEHGGGQQSFEYQVSSLFGVVSVSAAEISP